MALTSPSAQGNLSSTYTVIKYLRSNPSVNCISLFLDVWSPTCLWWWFSCWICIVGWQRMINLEWRCCSRICLEGLWRTTVNLSLIFQATNQNSKYVPLECESHGLSFGHWMKRMKKGRKKKKKKKKNKKNKRNMYVPRSRKISARHWNPVNNLHIEPTPDWSMHATPWSMCVHKSTSLKRYSIVIISLSAVYICFLYLDTERVPFH